MGNSLQAFRNIIAAPLATINPAKISDNRINNVGDALEEFLKDLYASTVDMDDLVAKDAIHKKIFSWEGNSSNPPDFVVRGGDAVEVKKIKSLTATIALNSSYPKNKLRSDDLRVASGAKRAEDWVEKDIVYAIGSVPAVDLQRLWLVYGDCIAASHEVYEKVVDPISTAARSVFSQLGFKVEVPTNEIAKFNKVDPLQSTDLRVRGMWSIKNPSTLFADIVQVSLQRQYYLLMREEKYQSFPAEDREYLEHLKKSGFTNRKVNIPNPDEPTNLIVARLISYEI